MNSNRTIAVIFLFCVTVAILWAIFLIIPLSKEIHNYSERIIEGKKAAISFKNKLDMVEEIEKERAILSQNLRVAESLFTDYDVPVNLIRFWEKTARECDLKIDINPISSGKSDYFNWKTMQFEISLAGDYSEILRFITKIESGPFLAQSQNLILSKSSDSGDLNAGLKVFVFAK